MNRKYLTTLAVLAALGASVRADDSSGGIMDRLFGTEHAQAMTKAELKMSLSVKDYLGVNLIDGRGERLGRIADFTLKDKDSGFNRAVVAVPGKFGFSEVLISVPFDEIHQKPGTTDLVWNVRQADFNALVTKAKNKEAGTEPAQTATSPKAGSTANEATQTRQPSDPDVQKVRAAIASEKAVATEAKNLTIQKQDDGKIMVSGAVDSNAQRQRIIEVAKNATRCEVVDGLRVN
jgi:sporulation protein YlmC with PRC-barrel domain